MFRSYGPWSGNKIDYLKKLMFNLCLNHTFYCKMMVCKTEICNIHCRILKQLVAFDGSTDTNIRLKLRSITMIVTLNV